MVVLKLSVVPLMVNAFCGAILIRVAWTNMVDKVFSAAFCERVMILRRYKTGRSILPIVI